MLGEFATVTTPKCKESITKVRAITTNTGVDTVDLTALESDAAALAAEAFMNPNLPGATATIAMKDAYDSVQAHTRLSKVFARDRANYYTKADEELAVETKYLEHQEALFLKYLEFSG